MTELLSLAAYKMIRQYIGRESIYLYMTTLPEKYDDTSDCNAPLRLWRNKVPFMVNDDRETILLKVPIGEWSAFSTDDFITKYLTKIAQNYKEYTV